MRRGPRNPLCVRCGLRGGTVRLPGGSICPRCRFHLAYHPVACPECAQQRPIAYPSLVADNVLVCAGCAGEESVFACAGCGREDHPYGGNHCARCVLVERLTSLLTDPTTGTIHERLRPLYDELVTARRPQSVITWLQKPPATGVKLLGLMARSELPISHDTFRGLPADRSHNYLRDLLASTGVLPPYHPPIEQIERWLDTTLQPLDDEDKGLVGRYARWHLLRRLRATADRGELTKAAIYSARGNINGAVRLGQWAARHGTTIAGLTQPQLESYLADYPGARNSQQSFVAWLGRARVNTTIAIPWRGTTMPEVTVTDADRWDQINTLLHDDAIALHARIGGLFTLLFAQPLETVVAMRVDQITLTDDGTVLVTFDTVPVEMPPGLDDLIRRHLDRPGSPSIASADHGWLFPGRHPGRHLVRETFRGHLARLGVQPGRGRHAAMFALAGQVPAPVLAELIGIADTTAVRWAALAARDWSTYIAQRGR